MPSGGFRPGAGRPRKSDKDKASEGRAVKAKKPAPITSAGVAASLSAAPKTKKAVEGVMNDFFAMALKECRAEVPTAEVLRAEIEDYIASRGCADYVAPQTITDYILNRQGFLACECMNRKIGRMTREFKLSPYVTAGQAYYKAMREDFNLIVQTIYRYGSDGQDTENNAFLSLMLNRGF